MSAAQLIAHSKRLIATLDAAYWPRRFAQYRSRAQAQAQNFALAAGRA